MEFASFGSINIGVGSSKLRINPQTKDANIIPMIRNFDAASTPMPFCLARFFEPLPAVSC